MGRWPVKGVVFSFVLGLELLAVGCAALDQYREGPPPVTQPAQAQAQQIAPQAPAPGLTLPPGPPPDPSQFPPFWYWSDQQRQQSDRYLQQQWQFYNQNRQPPPQFQRPPICTSTLLGGQIITTCR
jgi:hypothetical protein